VRSALVGDDIFGPPKDACDVFYLKNRKVGSFHCYVAVPILGQLGVFKNLSAAIGK
jgi:hypothetical protein